VAAPSSPTILAALHASTATTTLVLVVLLVALGVAMVLTAVWLVRATRSDAPALAPVEAMGSRRWRRAGADRRATLLSAARPDGAPDPAPTVPYGDDPEVAPVAPVAPAAAAESAPVPNAGPVTAPEPEPEPTVDEGSADGTGPEPGSGPEHEEQPVATPESS
jgi:hypothetical protein